MAEPRVPDPNNGEVSYQKFKWLSINNIVIGVTKYSNWYDYYLNKYFYFQKFVH